MMSATTLPADSHVHSEWSWDARRGDMEGSCARAVELGLPAIAFTEHLDHTKWRIGRENLTEGDALAPRVDADGILTPPEFDPTGYLDAIDRCRHRFRGLRIISGVEIGEPHWHPSAVADVLAVGQFDRVLGSLHCLPHHGFYTEPEYLFSHRDAVELVREYLAEIVRLVGGSDDFAVLAHIDYPVRTWPATAGPYDPKVFEDEYRAALRALAASGRALEVNTKVPLPAELVGWWADEGGRAVTFGSDAHDPTQLARGFPAAVAMVESYGFRPGRYPQDVWSR